MGLIARQFGRPSGLTGRLVGRLMARNNAAFNRWVVGQLAAAIPAPATVVELGSGPGVGLRALLGAFPDAHIIGVDPSAALHAQAARRNQAALANGRLRLVEGEAGAVVDLGPADLVVAVHVLYFWHHPQRDLAQIGELLATGGRLALGYQLRPHMPAPAQRDFPTEGHRLYESDDEVRLVLRDAGFETDHVTVFGDPARPGGRLLLATWPDSSS